MGRLAHTDCGQNIIRCYNSIENTGIIHILFLVVEFHNLGMAEIERDLWRPPDPTSLSGRVTVYFNVL